MYPLWPLCLNYVYQIACKCTKITPQCPISNAHTLVYIHDLICNRFDHKPVILLIARKNFKTSWRKLDVKDMKDIVFSYVRNLECRWLKIQMTAALQQSEWVTGSLVQRKFVFRMGKHTSIFHAEIYVIR